MVLIQWPGTVRVYRKVCKSAVTSALNFERTRRHTLIPNPFNLSFLKYRSHVNEFSFLIKFYSSKNDVAEERGIVFMLEETCNRVKLALVEVKEHAQVT